MVTGREWVVKHAIARLGLPLLFFSSFHFLVYAFRTGPMTGDVWRAVVGFVPCRAASKQLLWTEVRVELVLVCCFLRDIIS